MRKCGLLIAAGAVFSLSCVASAQPIKISQVYGGGGNTGAGRTIDAQVGRKVLFGRCNPLGLKIVQVAHGRGLQKNVRFGEQRTTRARDTQS